MNAEASGLVFIIYVDYILVTFAALTSDPKTRRGLNMYSSFNGKEPNHALMQVILLTSVAVVEQLLEFVYT